MINACSSSCTLYVQLALNLTEFINSYILFLSAELIVLRSALPVSVIIYRVLFLRGYTNECQPTIFDVTPNLGHCNKVSPWMWSITIPYQATMFDRTISNSNIKHVDVFVRHKELTELMRKNGIDLKEIIYQCNGQTLT